MKTYFPFFRQFVRFFNTVKMQNSLSFGFQLTLFQDLSTWTLDYESKYLSNETHYPNVALYNLDKDPGETENLAGKKRNLVLKLVKEAAELLDKDALPLFVGDTADDMAPKVKDLNVFYVQSTNLADVVPSQPWLDDDVDVTEFPEERLIYFLKGSNKNSIAFQMGLVFALWALTPIVFMYSLVLCC